MERHEIRSKLKEVMELATLPTVALKAVQLLRDEDVNVAKVKDTVSLDQSMTAKILRLVNSSFYGFQGKISSLSQAIILLGFNTVRNVILSVTVLQAFSGAKASQFFNTGLFWKHSVGTAFVAKKLAEHIRYNKPEDAFVGGLLHDVGRVFILQFLRDELIKIVGIRDHNDLSLREAEERVLGVDHAWIGAGIAKNWHFPPLLCSGIGYHHAPSVLSTHQEDYAIASLIHLADIICRGLNIGWGGDDFVPDVDLAAWHKLSLQLDDIKVIIRNVDQDLYQIEDFLNILNP